MPDIVNHLPALRPREHGNPQVVLLLTPSLAGLLRESSNFLGSALGRIFPQLTSSRSTAAGCDLLAVVVDRLPGLRAHSEQIQSGNWALDNGAEGISALVACSPPKHAIDMLSQADSHTTHEENMAMSNRVSFLLPFKGEGNAAKRIILDIPLANTFLQTGREFTIDASRWMLETESDKWVRSRSSEKPSVQVRLPEMPIEQQAPRSLHIPVIPLTVPRQISDIYGNILRRLQMDGEDAVPGSHELENRLEAYFRSQGWTSRPTNVWALILPQDHIRKDSEGRLIYSGNRAVIPLLTAEDVQKSWSIKDSNSINQLSELIANGASLYRILSGGGGWGHKQGLLSLDPDTGYSHDSETLSSGSMEGEELDGVLPKIAAPGDYIQFFMSSPGPIWDHEVFETQPGSSTARRGSRRPISLVFGATESIMDTIPSENVQSQFYVFLDGCFGALSGQGMVMSMNSINPSTGVERLSTSKIDVPYSTFRVQISPGEEDIGKAN